MSVKLMAQVWDHSPHSGSDLLMLLAIADHANDQGLAWPSIPTLAKKCRVHRRQAIYIIRNLEKAGSISIVKGGGRGRASVYKVNGAVECTLSEQTVHSSAPFSEETVQPSAPFSKTVQPSAPFTEEKVHPSAPLMVDASKEKMHSRDIKGALQCTPTIIEPIKKDKPPSIISPQGEIADASKAAKVKSPKLTRCPVDYMPSPLVRLWAQEKCPMLDIDASLEAMRDWEFKTPRSDWDAVLRTWMRREAENPKAHHKSDPTSPLSEKGQRNLAAAQRIIARMNGHDEPRPVTKISRLLE